MIASCAAPSVPPIVPGRACEAPATLSADAMRMTRMPCVLHIVQANNAFVRPAA